MYLLEKLDSLMYCSTVCTGVSRKLTEFSHIKVTVSPLRNE